MARPRSARKIEKSSPASPASARSLPLPPGDEPGAAEVASRVGDNLRRHRKSRDLSLDDLGDSVSFAADKPHIYENPGATESRYHDVILYDR